MPHWNSHSWFEIERVWKLWILPNPTGKGWATMTEKWRRGYSLLLPRYSSRQEVPSDSSMLLRCIYSQQSMFSCLFPNLPADLTILFPPISIQYVRTFWNRLHHIQDERAMNHTGDLLSVMWNNLLLKEPPHILTEQVMLLWEDPSGAGVHQCLGHGRFRSKRCCCFFMLDLTMLHSGNQINPFAIVLQILLPLIYHPV